MAWIDFRERTEDKSADVETETLAVVDAATVVCVDAVSARRGLSAANPHRVINVNTLE
jgi:hypothetical protein